MLTRNVAAKGIEILFPHELSNMTIISMGRASINRAVSIRRPSRTAFCKLIGNTHVNGMQYIQHIT